MGISLFFHPNSFLQHTLLDNHATQKQKENSVKQMLYKFLFLFECSKSVLLLRIPRYNLYFMKKKQTKN